MRMDYMLKEKQCMMALKLTESLDIQYFECSMWLLVQEEAFDLMYVLCNSRKQLNNQS